MRVLTHVSVLALLWVSVGRAHDDKSSKMVLKVEKEQVALAEKTLASIKGVKNIKYDETSGQLVVLYDKPTLGCCSRIHSALREAGVQYTLVSNQEYPACKDKHEKEHSEAAPSAPVQQTSVKKEKKKACCAGQKRATACCKAS
ncbi:MAG: hypothetical protein N2170_05780 [Bacteroidia bacterium]|nr:hypothetical protein [Bacteroidia bacterium]